MKPRKYRITYSIGDHLYVKRVIGAKSRDRWTQRLSFRVIEVVTCIDNCWYNLRFHKGRWTF